MEPEFRTISSSAAPGDPTSEGAAESSWKSMNARAIGEARLGKIITDYCKAGFSADVAGYRERYVEAGVVDWGAMGEGVENSNVCTRRICIDVRVCIILYCMWENGGHG